MRGTSHVLFSFLCLGYFSVHAATSAADDWKTQRKELEIIGGHYKRLMDGVWSSEAGKERLTGLSRGKDIIMKKDFFELIASRKESPMNPCFWLMNTREAPESETVKSQFKSCSDFVSNLRMMHPYIKRNVEFAKCGGPINCIKSGCEREGLYADAIEYDYPAVSVECWLTCGAINRYIEEFLPKYDDVIKTYERGFDENRRLKEEAAKKAEEERKRKISMEAEKQRRAKLKISKECHIAEKAAEICHSYVVAEDAKKRLIDEQAAGTVSGYVDRNVLRNLEMGVNIAAEGLKSTQSHYQKFSGESFPVNECEGWVRGLNAAHPVVADMNEKCGN